GYFSTSWLQRAFVKGGTAPPGFRVGYTKNTSVAAAMIPSAAGDLVIPEVDITDPIVVRVLLDHLGDLATRYGKGRGMRFFVAGEAGLGGRDGGLTLSGVNAANCLREAPFRTFNSPTIAGFQGYLLRRGEKEDSLRRKWGLPTKTPPVLRNVR